VVLLPGRKAFGLIANLLDAWDRGHRFLDSLAEVILITIAADVPGCAGRTIEVDLAIARHRAGVLSEGLANFRQGGFANSIHVFGSVDSNGLAIRRQLSGGKQQAVDVAAGFVQQAKPFCATAVANEEVLPPLLFGEQSRRGAAAVPPGQEVLN